MLIINNKLHTNRTMCNMHIIYFIPLKKPVILIKWKTCWTTNNILYAVSSP